MSYLTIRNCQPKAIVVVSWGTGAGGRKGGFLGTLKEITPKLDRIKDRYSYKLKWELRWAVGNNSCQWFLPVKTTLGLASPDLVYYFFLLFWVYYLSSQGVVRNNWFNKTVHEVRNLWVPGRWDCSLILGKLLSRTLLLFSSYAFEDHEGPLAIYQTSTVGHCNMASKFALQPCLRWEKKGEIRNCAPSSLRHPHSPSCQYPSQ